MSTITGSTHSQGHLRGVIEERRERERERSREEVGEDERGLESSIPVGSCKISGCRWGEQKDDEEAEWRYRWSGLEGMRRIETMAKIFCNHHFSSIPPSSILSP